MTPDPSKLGYLASPISHPSKAIRMDRYMAALGATVSLTKSGWRVYCPHLHWCDASELLDLPEDWGFWGPLSKTFLLHCDFLLVLTTDGWLDSQGVTQEIAWARERKMPVHLTDGIVLFELEE